MLLVYTDPSFYAAALTAVIILGLAKGGFNGLGLMAVPLLALVISPVQAAAILLPVMLVLAGSMRAAGPASR